MSKANIGDLIRIVDAIEGYPYKNGDIFEVFDAADIGGDVLIKVEGEVSTVCVARTEYVIHRKAGEEDESPIHTYDVCNSPLGEITCSSMEGGSLCSAKCADAYEIQVRTAREIEAYEKHKAINDAINPSNYEQGRVEVVSGVGPDAPIVENEFGAKQSKSPYRMDLIDAKALLEIAKVHSQGAEKYGDTNWRNISIEDNLNHALVHVYAYLAGDKQDDHLSHAATRMIFALALDLATDQK